MNHSLTADEFASLLKFSQGGTTTRLIPFAHRQKLRALGYIVVLEDVTTDSGEQRLESGE
jgi:hypothetical protein